MRHRAPGPKRALVGHCPHPQTAGSAGASFPTSGASKRAWQGPGYGTKKLTFVNRQRPQIEIVLYNGIRGLRGWGYKELGCRDLSYVAYQLYVSFFQGRHNVVSSRKENGYIIDAKGIYIKSTDADEFA